MALGITTTADSPHMQHPAYSEMLTTWELTKDLMGGTRTMRAASTKWLPKEEKEKDAAYEARLSRSVLFETYREAVETLSNRPFSYPVSLVGPDLPEPLDQIERHCDDQGRNLTQFCAHILKIAIDRGLVHILVDNPKAGATNLAEERELKLKPYFLAIDPMDMLNWRYETAANGEKRLTQICIREWYDREDGEFSMESGERVRVIRPTEWKLYEQAADGEKDWTVTEEGSWSLGEISLVTIYFDKENGFMTARPPLEGLAWLNLAHYQSMSDHRNNIRFARAGTVTATGITEDELEKGFVWGVNRIISSINPNARFDILEHSGAAVKVGEDELRHLEEMMQVLGKAPLMVQSWGNRTAMGEAIDEGKSSCDLQAWVRSAEGGLRRCFEYAAKWRGQELPEDFGVDIWDDFGMVQRSDKDIATLLELFKLGLLTKRTTLRQVQVRGTITEDMDVDKEIAAKEAEGPDPGMIGRLKQREEEEPEEDEEEPEEEKA